MGIIDMIKKLYFKSLSPEKKAKYLKDKVHYLGENVQIYTTDIGTEPYLISIDDNVTVAAGVHFITHDVSCFHVSRYLKLKNRLDKVGSIVLHKNCMIGAHTILMPGCSVGENSIIAAGSIVTKAVPDGEVWGGNPAKFIMTIDEYSNKLLEINNKYPWMKNGKVIAPHGSSRLEEIREKYFFVDSFN
ncbi:acyltransferase [Butyrivibrio sp. MB2005]|uniref:acyltransferase n=1 Tax=Butyrivibrio sp. MB2005 TaxID=1280678 RepID=UPI00047AD920|nr:acyltransferase [Butyrivibrio sp. MB2005]